MNKTQKILLGVVILQIALIVIVFVGLRPKAARNEPLLAGLDTAQVSAIQIKDNSNNVVELAKQGESWVLANGTEYPVLTQSVSSLLEAIQDIRTGRLVTSTSSSHQRLEVSTENYQRQVTITAGKDQFTLYLGSSPAPSNVHVRLEGDNAVYLTNAISVNSASAQVSNWIDTAFVQLDANTVSGVTVKNGNGTFQFSRGADNAWQFAGSNSAETLDPSLWSSYLTAFTNLRMIVPVSTSVEERFGLNSPTAQVTLRYLENSAEKEATLTIGQQDPIDQNYFVQWSNSPYVVKISSFNAERIINLALTDLVTPQATATP